jgi:hypothetical protein
MRPSISRGSAMLVRGGILGEAGHGEAVPRWKEPWHGCSPWLPYMPLGALCHTQLTRPLQPSPTPCPPAHSLKQISSPCKPAFTHRISMQMPGAQWCSSALTVKTADSSKALPC